MDDGFLHADEARSEDCLRGHARALDLEPLSNLTLQAKGIDVRFTWPTLSPQVGSLRQLLEFEGAQLGDHLLVSRNAGELEWLLVRKEQVGDLLGPERVAAEIGVSPQEPDLIAALSRSLGLHDEVPTVQGICPGAPTTTTWIATLFAIALSANSSISVRHPLRKSKPVARWNSANGQPAFIRSPKAAISPALRSGVKASRASHELFPASINSQYMVVFAQLRVRTAAEPSDSGT